MVDFDASYTTYDSRPELGVGSRGISEQRSARVLEFLERTLRQKIHRCRQCDHDQGERRVDERSGDGRDIDEMAMRFLRAIFLFKRLNSGSVMITSDRRR